MDWGGLRRKGDGDAFLRPRIPRRQNYNLSNGFAYLLAKSLHYRQIDIAKRVQ